jgi:hypothetical protein
MVEISFSSFISADSLSAPFNSDHILFKLMITATSLTKMQTEKTEIIEIKIPYSHEEYKPSNMTIPLDMEPDRLVLAVLSVQFYIRKNDHVELVTNLNKLPCGVVWSGWI